MQNFYKHSSRRESESATKSINNLRWTPKSPSLFELKTQFQEVKTSKHQRGLSFFPTQYRPVGIGNPEDTWANNINVESESTAKSKNIDKSTLGNNRENPIRDVNR